jgi:hypothetical protein
VEPARPIKALRTLTALVAVVALVAVACRVQPPAPGDAPAFVIATPQEGASVSGAFFFAVQALDPGAVAGVSYTANGVAQAVDFAGEDRFRVFVVASDFPEDEIELSATVTGTNGQSSTQIVTVVNESNPPSSTVVGPNGAVLASAEANGGTSLLTLAPGVGEGASVSFSARSETEILAETGVNYGALGVTFLGAQEIESDRPLDGPLGIVSGGFGPMVPADHAVVNYAIFPDANDDGTGELVVINSARVAPNGDVISDPPPTPLVGSTASLAGARGSSIRALQSGLSGPPGTILSFEVNGFKAASPLGNVALFTSLVGGKSYEVSLGLWPREDGEDGPLTAKVVIPPLPEGGATLVLREVSSGFATEPIDITVEPLPPFGADAADVIDEYYAAALAAVDQIRSYLFEEVDRLEELRSNLVGQRANFQQLAATADPEILAVLQDIATLIVGSDAIAELEVLLPGIRTQQAGSLCLTPEQTAEAKRLIETIQNIERGANAVLCAAALLLLNPVLAVGCGFAIAVTILTWEWDWVPFPECGEDPNRPDPLSCLPTPIGGPSDPTALRVQQAPPPPLFTGMGSGIPPGGDGCGFSNGPAPGGPSGLRGSSDGAVFQAVPGRVVVRAFANGQRLPFRGAVDAAGYFYLPFLAAGAEIELTAIDTETGATRTASFTGPDTGVSQFVSFDFSDSGPPAGSVVWDGGGDGSSWDDPLNWSGDELPGPDDDVVIDVSGDVTVVHSGAAGTTTINRLTCAEALTLSGGTLTIAGPSQIDGTFTLSGGTLDGTGDLTVADAVVTGGSLTGLGTLIVPAGATLDFAGPATANLRRDLDNAGTVLWSGGNIFSGDAVIVDNLAGALFDIRTDGSFNGNAFGSISMTFNHAGALRKSAGLGVSELRGLLMSGDGGVEVASGAITNWFSNGSHGGALTGVGEYRVGSGTHVFAPESSIAVAHFTTVGGGTVTVEGGYDVGTTTEVSSPLIFAAGADIVDLGATLFVNGVFGDVDLSSGGTVSVPTLTIVAGDLRGSDLLTVTSAATMTGGSMLGDGTTAIPDGVTLTLNGGGVHGLGRNLDNAGSVVLQSGFIHGGRTFDNLATGLIDLQVDGSWNGNALVGVPNLTLHNGGTLRKSGGGGEFEIRGARFDGDGTVEIDSGTLATLFADATLSGAFVGAPGTTLSVEGVAQLFDASSSIEVPNLVAGGMTVEGSYDVSGTTEVVGAFTLAPGATVVDLGATLQLSSGAAVADLGSGAPLTVPSLVQTAGTLTGSDDLTVTADATWSGGTQSGSGRTLIDTTVPLAIGGDALKALSERTIDIDGSATWTGTGPINGGLGAALNVLANGVLDVQNDAILNGFGAGGAPIATMTVAGTLRKTVAVGVSNWTVDCQDDGGTFDFQTGDIVFSEGTCP